MMRRLAAVLIGAAALIAAPGFAHADDLDTGQFANLGAAAATGDAAFAGIAGRAQSLHLAMACGNEFDFVKGYSWTSRDGRSDDNPGTEPANEERKWPLDLMLGKAALLGDPDFRTPPPGSDGDTPGCTSTLGTIEQVRAWWPLAAKDGRVHPEEDAVSLVNRVYQEWFGLVDGSRSAACERVAEEYIGEQRHAYVSVRLTPACMARQIRAVMSDPGHGPWRKKFNSDTGEFEVVPELAGTDPKDLPCLSEFRLGTSGVGGDWDMAVTDYTRLTHLLYAVDPTRTGMDQDIAAALDVLNQRFLTLRSSPGDATARDGFNLTASCGNSPNKFGSAMDTMNGGGGDPGVGRYGPDGKDAVDGSSFWDSLLHFLTVLLVVAIAALIAAIVGSIIGGFLAMVTGQLGLAFAAGTVVVAVAISTLFVGRIEETENHLLMQNSARYLKNKLMMAELGRQGHREEFDDLAELNETVREWLLDDMARIVEDDFLEYNSKPYARLSHFALLNLIDFACDFHWDYALAAQTQNTGEPCDAKDRAVVDAAAAVLDLSAAKAAVGSLDGRRMIPFRRKAEVNKHFYNIDGNPFEARRITELVGGADTMVAAMQIWTGQMRFTETGTVGPDTFGQLVFYSSSRYRPDPLILGIAVDKKTPRWQQYDHHGHEAYSSGPGWLITAGGNSEGPANGLELPLFTIYSIPVPGRDDQRGVGVPTTLMTDAARDISDPGRRFSRIPDFLRFEGNVENWDGNRVSYSDNNCVTRAFACGLRPRTPTYFDAGNCATTISDRFIAIDSTRCPAIGLPADPSLGLYIAFYDHDPGHDPEHDSDQDWGFFEVAQRDRFGSIDDFIATVRDRNRDHLGEWGDQVADDEVTYVTIDGQTLQFTPEDEDFSADHRACGIVNHEDGPRFTISDVPAEQSGKCRPVGRNIVIDLDDARNPVREAKDGAPLDPLY